MAKQSILGRISQLLRANINALLDQAEDPQMMLDQLVRDYTNSIAEAESAVAQTIGNLRLMEQDAGFARAVARALAERILDLLGELEASLQHSSLQRLACYLDSLAVPNGQPGSWIVRLPATKTTVAARLGIKKETLSRMLRELATRNLIAVAGPEVAILDRSGLALLAAAPG